MKLTDEQLQSCPKGPKVYRLFDGEGLYAEVPVSGRIRWRYKFHLAGVERRLSVGTYPLVSIEQARIERDKLKKLVKAGVDPSTQRKVAKFHNGKNSDMHAMLNAISFVKDTMRSMLDDIRK